MKGNYKLKTWDIFCIAFGAMVSSGLFVLFGTKDERNFHLRSLMAIAQIVRGCNFYDNWMRMKDPKSLKMLVLSSTRKRN